MLFEKPHRQCLRTHHQAMSTTGSFAHHIAPTPKDVNRLHAVCGLYKNPASASLIKVRFASTDHPDVV
jgi:hypothetical protein